MHVPIEPQATASDLWWQQIHEDVLRLEELLSNTPTAIQQAATTAIIAELKQVYDALQRTCYPVHTVPIQSYLTRAVLHLRLSYEEAARHHPERSDRYYDMALTEWRRFNSALHLHA